MKFFGQIGTPIGVNDMEEARSEYISYTNSIFSLIINNQAAKEVIAEKLHEIETVMMGLSGDIEHCRMAADKIIALTL